MGVRGLTSFIAKNAEQYLRPFELHDCNLVIDGDNLACNLFKDVSNCNSAFGGDYDEYYRTVIGFFHLLYECNICAFVIMDGGYEQKKLKTVVHRLRSKIGYIKHLDPSKSGSLFPLMMREVFINAVQDSGVHVMRCLFEADDELAALARKLNCPLLSYDSDFYIHNVKYIPLITLTMKVHEKKVNKLRQSNTELRYCEARNLKKRKKMNRGLNIATVSSENPNDVVTTNRTKTIKYLDCCIYRVEHLIEKGSLSKSKLPLFAALLGNDYIQAKLFRNFFNQVGMKGVNKKIPKHQKRVMAILKWLKHESLKTALDKVMGSIKKEQREYLLGQIQAATEGYSNEKCVSFDFFQLNETDVISCSENSDEDCEDSSDIISTDDDKNDGIKNSDSEYNYSNDEINSDIGDQESEVNSEIDDVEKSDLNELVSKVSNLTIATDTTVIPDWMQNRIHAAKLPRFISDLYSLKLYINNPQIENFLFHDCNEITLEILIKIFSLLHHPNTPELRYLTRVTRLTNAIYKKFPSVPITRPLDANEINIEIMKEVFEKLGIDHVQLFNDLERIPKNLQLYLLAIIYWSHKSKNSNILHLLSLLVCLVVLQVVDTKIKPIRQEKTFHKKFGKLIQKERSYRMKLTILSDDSPEKIKILKQQKLLEKLEVPEKIKYLAKIECMLVQENLLKYFSYHENNRHKHTEYSSSILHGFSEFQSVAYQLYCLNILINSPFETIKMSQFYCGIFLYNIYVSLQKRVDCFHFIENCLFKESTIMYEYFQYFIKLLHDFVPFLKQKNNDETRTCKKSKKKRNAGKKNLNKIEVNCENLEEIVL